MKELCLGALVPAGAADLCPGSWPWDCISHGFAGMLRSARVAFHIVFLHGGVFSWLNLFNAELRPKKYWRGLRSHELGEERDCT